MSEPVVTVQEGKVRGRTADDIEGNQFYSFQGIPYAKPPVGTLRFKAPEPPEPWDGILDGTKDGNECYAKNNTHSCAEECLVINVFTKEIRRQKLKPVMVWIHGGGFSFGSSHSDIYGADFLLMQDIVLVTFNYRLGVLGFLCLEDSTLGVPGNAGLKDMVMALKWVQINIKEFSGDPNNVTVFGESAGGASVHFLMLSPMAKGLFHKAIAQSGCALNGWTRGERSVTYLLANILGIESDDDKIILKQLQELPIEVLYNGVKKIKDSFYIGRKIPFGPVIEKDTTSTTFLNEEPVDLVKSGRYHKIPLIMGYCSREGMFIYDIFNASKSRSHLLHDETIVPYSMNLRIGSDEYNSTVKKIKNFYFNGKDPLENKDNVYRLYTDNYFLLEIYNAARYTVATGNSPTYFYRFSLETTLNFLKSATSITESGACHGDDMFYLFKSAFTPEDIKPGSSEYMAIQKIIRLWTNFAKFGNPTPPDQCELLNTNWQPIQSQKFNYLEIGEHLEMKTDPEKEAMDFWNNLYKKTSTTKAKL